MKKLLLPVAVCCFVQISSAQPFTGSNPLDIHVNASNPADLGLLIQGNTGAIGALGVEGNAAGTVYCLAGTVANNMIMGVLNSDGTGPSAINIDYQNHVGINTLNTSNYLVFRPMRKFKKMGLISGPPRPDSWKRSNS